MAKPNPKAPTVVNQKFKLDKRIGGGSFGDIYKASLVGTNELYAVKLEPINAKMPQLLYECKLYKHFSGGQGIPSIKWWGTEGNYNIMVMELLGKSLEDLMCDKSRPHFSLKTSIMVVDQMICRLEYIHNKDYVHRDIKPDNFVMGRDTKKNSVYAIDFGLAKRYRDSSTHQHIPYKDGRGVTGTVRYASINSQQGMEQGRRDDLESIGYVMIYFITGSVPWQGLKIENRNQKFRAICDMKMSIPVDQLCKDCPSEIAQFMKYVKDLAFDSKPDYYYLRKLLRSLFVKNNYTLDYIYDWTLPEGQEEKEEEEGAKRNKKKHNEDGDTIDEEVIERESDETNNNDAMILGNLSVNRSGTDDEHSGAGYSMNRRDSGAGLKSRSISPSPPDGENETLNSLLVGGITRSRALQSAAAVPITALTPQQQQQLLHMQEQMTVLHGQAQQYHRQLLQLHGQTQQQIVAIASQPLDPAAAAAAGAGVGGMATLQKEREERTAALQTQYRQQSQTIIQRISQIQTEAQQLFNSINAITCAATAAVPSSSSAAASSSEYTLPKGVNPAFVQQQIQKVEQEIATLQQQEREGRLTPPQQQVLQTLLKQQQQLQSALRPS